MAAILEMIAQLPRHVTSSGHVVDRIGNIFGRILYHRSFVVIALKC